MTIVTKREKITPIMAFLPFVGWSGLRREVVLRLRREMPVEAFLSDDMRKFFQKCAWAASNQGSKTD